MSSPLPKLPASPLGELPENPLGAPPPPPLIGRREPLRFPFERLHARRSGGGHAGSPLPSLHRRPRPTPHATAPQRPQNAAGSPSGVRAAAPAIIHHVHHNAPAGAPVAAPAPTPPAAQRPQLAGRMAQPPLNPRPGLHANLRQRMQARQRGAAGHAALHNIGANPMAQALRHHFPAAQPSSQSSQSSQPGGPGLTPQQRAQMQAQAAAIRAALNNTGSNPMAHAMRHVGQPPPTTGGQP